MIATYRLQLTPDFGFDAVRALVPYFQRLGVSHLYLSPITESRPDSAHGYDVIDHNTIRSDFGGREAFDRLLETAREAGLRLILDFVPNHAGVGSHNEYWQDVLAYGPYSPFDHYFDIDWDPLKEALRGKVLLPFLGRPYGEVLDDGEIGITYDDGRFFATYYDHHFALTPSSYADILHHLMAAFERQEAYFDLKDVQEAYAKLKPDERQKAETLRSRLLALGEHLDLDAASFDLGTDALHALLEQQFWRLAYWKTAGFEINYRRFFDINGLVALRMEDEDVFWDAHQLLGELLALDGVDGVRIDHIDGLFDPHGYLEGLRELGAQRIWVEKILARGETLPEAWPVEGATGYAFMNDVMGVLLHPDGDEPLKRTYRRFVPDANAYDDDVYQSKDLVMNTSLSSELFRLSYGLNRLSEADYHTRDFTLGGLREALAELIAALRRYRTYLPHDPDEAEEVIRKAIHRARQRNPASEPLVYEFIADVILGNVREDLRPAQTAWTGRFQQYTAPVAAKGVEDTAFYRHFRLVALNEVGGEPDHFGLSAEAFHARARFRAHRYPHGLLATSTHDHKRGGDLRMRLLVLAEVPEAWQDTLRRLMRLARPFRQPSGPSLNDEYLFFQLLVALWPEADPDTLPDRLWQYMQKASRESKQYTSWINPDEKYEDALEQLIRSVLAHEELPDALGDLPNVLARHGFFNTLSQTVLHQTTPGVPDLYQGTEVLDLTLVDPDNRRPVDYAARHETLDALQELLEHPRPDVLETWIDEQDERAKFYLVARLLTLRRAHPDLFTTGSHHALPVEGAGGDHHLAFARSHEDAAAVVLVPRFPTTWADHRDATLPLPDDLAGRSWTEVLSGHALDAGDRLDTTRLPLPWTVLVAEE